MLFKFLNFTRRIGWLREQDLNLRPFVTMKSEPEGEFVF
ncbi:hypothetical protein GMES_1447 [Paraglaciecola mesophila KMM 241]|uniref:Uncharacterized protein n=1 Tax=Paraglaciecola mesophila KMM 241 TaxID=1128912 RepID=K6ZK23_9ALTE|nr:hypothetical protein GMES_1447 [Paraglaciecola mesophila KMM 241]